MNKLLLSLATTFLTSTLISTAQVPAELVATKFSGSDVTPCPACLCAAPTGEVFVGVDLNGSLGKGPSKGRVVRLIDTDHDGVADSHTVYADIDNPRGLISVGTQLFVLHTVIPKKTGKLEAMHLSVLEDKNWDGVADGPPKRLISGISVPKHNQDRGADHTTNSIAMGIDGWIYIAVGDFGFVGAKGVDGKDITMLGGGVVRVRPDGTEFEVYTHGLRNIYDVAIDPFMNLYTRGNTNDGGGWNIRFIHHVQSGEYGYPVLFKNFTDEIIPALEDLGGGSGTGAMFFSEPGWPEKYTNVPMMCDWGRSQLVIHRLTPDGASFTQVPENFIKLQQITDIDVDGSSAMYLGAWEGAGYKGNPGKGFVQRVVPKGWKHTAFPDLKKLSDTDLAKLLRSDSAKARLHAQQEILTRPADSIWKEVAKIAVDKSASLESRVAAIFTYKQMRGAAAAEGLLKLAEDPSVKEWALRALADRIPQNESQSTTPFMAALKDKNPRVQVAAAVALGRLGQPKAAVALLDVANPPAGMATKSEVAVKPKFDVSFKGKKLHPVEVDVKGWKEIYLVVTDGGDGSGQDHAAWFGPVFEKSDGTQIKLSSLKWKKAESEWGKLGFGTSPANRRLKSHAGDADPDGLGTHPLSVIVFDVPKDAVKFKAKAGIADTSPGTGRIQFLVSDQPLKLNASSDAGAAHATPNSAIVLPHVAVQALRVLGNSTPIVDAVGGKNSDGALWALRAMHGEAAVDGLIAKYGTASADDPDLRMKILTTLVRLYQKEAPYDGSWWWGTRPDTRGPYYKLAKWEGSEKIAAFVKEQYTAADAETKAALDQQLARHRAEISGIDVKIAGNGKTGKKKEKKVDLTKIANKKGQIGKMSIEDVILGISEVKGNAKAGKKIFTQQGCFACHTTDVKETLKGPFMGHVGSILSRDQIAESILKPNASISQGFATITVTTKDKKSYTGFISKETAEEIEVRDIAGNVTELKTKDIASRSELEISMMPPGLANALSLEEFASLITYLQEMKK